MGTILTLICHLFMHALEKQNNSAGSLIHMFWYKHTSTKTIKHICGVQQSGRGASTSGNYSTANDTWNSSVYKRCHASPWRHIVVSWRLFIVTSS